MHYLRLYGLIKCLNILNENSESKALFVFSENFINISLVAVTLILKCVPPPKKNNL